MYKQDLSFSLAIGADANGASPWFYVGDATIASIQIQYEADTAAAGTYTLESSNAPIGIAQASIEPTDTIEDSDFLIEDDGGSRTWNISAVGFNWVRVKFTFDTASPAQTVTGRLIFKGPSPA